MSADTTPTTPAASGLQATVMAKATEAGTALYLKAPPRAQTAILNGVVAVQPVVNALKPHATQLLGAGAGLLALRRFRGRKG